MKSHLFQCLVLSSTNYTKLFKKEKKERTIIINPQRFIENVYAVFRGRFPSAIIEGKGRSAPGGRFFKEARGQLLVLRDGAHVWATGRGSEGGVRLGARRLPSWLVLSVSPAAV